MQILVESIIETVYLKYQDEVVIEGKGLELCLYLEATIPIEVRIPLSNHIDLEYPFIDLEDD